MPRIIVTADPAPSAQTDAPVLLDEQVRSIHLSTGHAAQQLVERLAWAISDAENAESADSDRSTQQDRLAARRTPRARSAARQTVRA